MDKPDKDFELVESRDSFDDAPGFKSWKPEFTGEDVEKFLQEHDITNWLYDCIAGDGDVILVSLKYFIADIYELIRIKQLFQAPHLTIEEYDHALMLTLSWNQVK